jgi:hypothetical protein
MRPFSKIAALILAAVCVAHVLRLCLGWDTAVNGIHITVWLSGIGMIITGGLSVMLWRESRNRGC